MERKLGFWRLSTSLNISSTVRWSAAFSGVGQGPVTHLWWRVEGVGVAWGVGGDSWCLNEGLVEYWCDRHRDGDGLCWDTKSLSAAHHLQLECVRSLATKHPPRLRTPPYPGTPPALLIHCKILWSMSKITSWVNGWALRRAAVKRQKPVGLFRNCPGWTESLNRSWEIEKQLLGFCLLGVWVCRVLLVCKCCFQWNSCPSIKAFET